MPRWGSWKRFTKENISLERNTYGCYELGDLKGEPVYYGEGRVRQRLMAHWRNVADKSRVNWYRCIYFGRKSDAKKLEKDKMEAYKKKHGYLPRYSKR